ncbi:hypothetical protein EDD21DRAFT_377598 [Dissophora ornata]|nr:hypothetical protein EDD21DRAFT_377598 [Dissophora ornata]
MKVCNQISASFIIILQMARTAIATGSQQDRAIARESREGGQRTVRAKQQRARAHHRWKPLYWLATELHFVACVSAASVSHRTEWFPGNVYLRYSDDKGRNISVSSAME